jgi:hypothetical protein
MLSKTLQKQLTHSFSIVRRTRQHFGKDKKSSVTQDKSSSSSIGRAKTILVFGIVLAALGIVGTIYYGSQFVIEEVNPNAIYYILRDYQLKTWHL